MTTIAIIGGGFSGTLTAVHLLHMLRETSARILLINADHPPGRGLAYDTPDNIHVLNVPAENMSALPDDPGGFLRFAQNKIETANAGSYLPRALYGRYLHSLLTDAKRRAPTRAAVDEITGRVVRISRSDASIGGTLALEDGRRFFADRVVLALGNFPPANPPGVDPSLRTDSRYFADPWRTASLSRGASLGTVLLIGTGLTMVDLAMSIAANFPAAVIHAISRRGLLPHVHDGAAPLAVPPEVIREILAERRIPGLLRRIRTCVRRGREWRSVLASLRPHTSFLWDALSEVERKRFLRHARVYWEVHRHRMPPEIARRLELLRLSGRLRIYAGRIERIASSPAGLCALFHSRRNPRSSSGETERRRRSLIVDAAVNCTGPESDVTRLNDPLVQSLLADRMIRPDPLRLGIDATRDGRILDAAGFVLPGFFIVGPLRKPQFWECTAVPELRLQTAHLARTVFGDLRTNSSVSRAASLVAP